MPLHVFWKGQGPLVVLLHGIGASGSAWQKQADRLSDSYTCLAPDLPGYGESPDPEQPGLDAIADEIVVLLQGAPAHLVGVSFGALVALALARRHPERVRSLVLADATLGRAGDSEDKRRRWLDHRYVLAEELSSRSAERAAEIAGPGAPGEIVDEIARHMRRARPAGYRAVADIIAATDAVPWLPKIEQETLVVCGEHDRVTGLPTSQILERELPHARLITVAGAGHAPHIECPDRFAAEVRRFLDGKGG